MSTTIYVFVEKLEKYYVGTTSYLELWHFKQTVSLEDSLYDTSNLAFGERKIKYWWNIYPACLL